MITLTEKKVQELEMKVADYESRLSELQKKLDDLNNLSNDVRNVKDMLSIHGSNYNSFRQNVAELQGYNHKKLTYLESECAAHAKDLLDLKNSQENTGRTLRDQNTALGNITKKVSEISTSGQETVKALADLSTRQAQGMASLESAKQFLNKLNERTETHWGLHQQTGKIIGDLEEKVKNLQDYRYALTAVQSNQGGNMAALEVRLAAVEAKNSLPGPSVKNYDADISDIKKDITAILNVVHVTASNVPDNAQIKEKIKTMETAIAQIYSLIKKYENR